MSSAVRVTIATLYGDGLSDVSSYVQPEDDNLNFPQQLAAAIEGAAIKELSHSTWWQLFLEALVIEFGEHAECENVTLGDDFDALYNKLSADEPEQTE